MLDTQRRLKIQGSFAFIEYRFLREVHLLHPLNDNFARKYLILCLTPLNQGNPERS